MVGPERWQCIGMTRGGEACSRVVVFSADRLQSGHQPLCHQHLREVEEGLQREHLGAAAPSLAHGLRRCAAVGRLSNGRGVRCGKPAPCLSVRGSEGRVVLSQRLCDEHRRSLTQALIRQWQAEQAQAGAPASSSRGWGLRLGVRPG
ncbi:MAG TPA: hypothetical protein VII47_05750 [Actinomycetota bacterium]|jgi:hypothetical protein